MKSSKKATIILLVVGISLFGYSQYASASQIGVAINQSQLLEENDTSSTYDVELRFDNPSLLVMTAGITDFEVIEDDTVIGTGQLEPFILQPLGSTIAHGTFTTDSNDTDGTIKIAGTTKYNVIISTLEVPFEYYPTEEQAREFIQN